MVIGSGRIKQQVGHGLLFVFLRYNKGGDEDGCCAEKEKAVWQYIENDPLKKVL